MHCCLILKGYVNDAFNNNYMNEFIEYINNRYENMDIYIQSWCKKNEEERSYNQGYITQNTVMSYFNRNHLIKKIILLDKKDEFTINNENIISNKLIKNKLLNDKKLKDSWKGNYFITEHIINTNINYDFVINMKIDFFGNNMFQNVHNKKRVFKYKILSKTTYDINYKFLYLRIVNYLNQGGNNSKKLPFFLDNKEFPGIDNFYIGNMEQMHKLSKLFYIHFNYLIQNLENKYLYINTESILYKVSLTLDRFVIPE